MALTKDFKETVKNRALRDENFRKAMLQEGVDALLCGEVDIGKSMLRDYINATVGFAELSGVTGNPPKSLMRMFGPDGNPSARNLFAVIAFLQQREGIRVKVDFQKK